MQMIVICASEAKSCDRPIINDPSQELIRERKADVVNVPGSVNAGAYVNTEPQHAMQFFVRGAELSAGIDASEDGRPAGECRLL